MYYLSALHKAHKISLLFYTLFPRIQVEIHKVTFGVTNKRGSLGTVGRGDSHKSQWGSIQKKLIDFIVSSH